MIRREASTTILLALTAVMTALVSISTMLIQIPIPATSGYFNIGDVMIMVAALTGGPIVGAFSGGVGASLADLLGGWYVYVIPTLIIKGTEGFLAGWILKKREKTIRNVVLAWVIGGGEMVFGYFLFQIYLYGFVAALGELGVNILQMVVGGVVGIPISQALKRMIRV